jgi:hypothetical protein
MTPPETENKCPPFQLRGTSLSQNVYATAIGRSAG